MNRNKRQRRTQFCLSGEALETRNLLATVALQNGLWDDPATWSDGVPDSNIRAVVPSGVTVFMDGTDHHAKELVVQGNLAVLESPGVDKSLTTDWIHVNSGGIFQAGAETARYDESNFVVTLTGDDPSEVFTVEGAGTITDNNGFLMVATGGQLQFFGQEKLAFTKLATTAEVNATEILVENEIDRNFDGAIDANDGALNWEVGDQIVIASSSRNYDEEEVRNITAIADQGNGTSLITLDSPLNNRHYGEIETYTNSGRFPDLLDTADFEGGSFPSNPAPIMADGLDTDAHATRAQLDATQKQLPSAAQIRGPRSWQIDMRAEVAILNRNIKIQGLASQDTDIAFGDRARYNPGTVDGFGGHTMIMGSAGQITIDSVQFDRMGQTSRLGRYPIHWHLAGDRTGDILRGASITNSNNRGVTVHGTHNLLIKGVVLHDVHGHGFFMEDGVETGNQYIANIALGIHKVGRSDTVGNNAPDLNDPFIVDTHDHVGQNELRFLSSAAYWVTNPDNTWIGNISAGADGTGFWFILPEFAIGASANDPQYANVNANETNLRQFDYNSSHSSHVGFNFDRGPDIEVPVGATLMDNAFGREYRPPAEPQFNHFTGYQHHVGVYHRGLIANFHENRFADNFTSTFITFTQRITDTLYVGHSRGNADLSEIVTGHSLYDGVNTMDGNHFAGFSASNAHTFRSHGGARRHTHHVLSNTSFENDGSTSAVSISTRTGGSTHTSPFFFGPAALYDVDGTLTGHVGGGAGSTVITDHPFFYDADDVQPAGWNAWISDDLYASINVQPINATADFTFTAPDGDTATEQGNSFNTNVKMDDGDYVVSFAEGVNSVADGFELAYYVRGGPNSGSTVFQFEGLGNTLAPLGIPRVSGLTALRNSNVTAYEVVADDLWVKFFSSTNKINFAAIPGSTVTLWNDPSPPGNSDGSAVTGIPDPFGTGMGDIGQWVTSGQNQFHNINAAGPALDVSGYNGFDYTFSFDYYVDSTQPLTDDTFYQNVYGATNFTVIGSGAVLDSWTTVIATGTIDTSTSTTVNPLIIVNHKNTTETTPSFYIDNIDFSINLPPSGRAVAASAMPPLEATAVKSNVAGPVDSRWLLATEPATALDTSEDAVLAIELAIVLQEAQNQSAHERALAAFADPEALPVTAFRESDFGQPQPIGLSSQNHLHSRHAFEPWYPSAAKYLTESSLGERRTRHGRP